MKVQRYRIYQPQPHSFVGFYLLLLNYCSYRFHVIRILLFNKLINPNGYLQIVWLLATTKHNQVWNMNILLVACHMRIYYWYNYSPQSWIIHASFKMITVPLSIFCYIWLIYPSSVKGHIRTTFSVVWRSWWRHQMEAFSALLAICAGNLPDKAQWRAALMFSMICAWINGWVNTGDLRRHGAHDDVVVLVDAILA